MLEQRRINKDKNMTITSFAQLKRELKPGVSLKLVDTNINKHKSLGIVRKIVIQRTNAVKLGDSWLGLGSTGEKASEFTFQENGFTYDSRASHPDYGVMLKYEFVQG